MLSPKRFRIFRFESSTAMSDMERMLKKTRGVAGIRREGDSSISFKATEKAYEGLLSHVTGWIFKGLVTVREVHPDKRTWTVDNQGKLIEKE